MGAGFHGGFGNGTTGAQDAQTQSLINELEKSGVKFTKEDVVFVTKDVTGKTVWLEKGNISVGLEHIISRHSEDFQSKHGISKSNIAQHIENVFRNGKVEYSRVTKGNGGYERLYNYNGKYYMITGIGKNGFIVSAYPVRETQALKLIERYGK